MLKQNVLKGVICHFANIAIIESSNSVIEAIAKLYWLQDGIFRCGYLLSDLFGLRITYCLVVVHVA